MSYRDPSSEDLKRPEFEAVWQAIKRWDINVPDQYQGYCGATGNHVMAILDALQPERDSLKAEVAELTRKGQLLCCQNGNILMENHELRRHAEAMADGLESEHRRYIGIAYKDPKTHVKKHCRYCTGLDAFRQSFPSVGAEQEGK